MLQKTPKTAKAKAAPTPKPFSIEIDRDALADAVVLVGTAVAYRNPVPIITHVLLRPFVSARGEVMCQVIGTDLDCWNRHAVACKHHNRVTAFTLPWYGLAKSLNQLPAGNLMIEVHPKDLRAHIKASDGTELTFDTLPPEDFPTERDVKGKASHVYVVGSAELLKLIETVQHAISVDASRYYLNGAYFQCLQKGVLRAVTTDGHRLVIDEIPAEGITKDTPALIVPMNTLKVVRKHCKTYPEAIVEVPCGTEGIAFDFGLGRIVQSKHIDGTFPDYQKIIPQKNDKFALIDNATLDGALSKCFSPTRRDKRAVKLSFKNKTLRLTQAGVNGMTAMTAGMSCDYDGPEFSIGFNPSYLRDALSILGDTVGFAFSDAGSPALIMSGELPQIVLMPMRF